MSFKSFVKQKLQAAIDTFFDNTGTDFASSTVQEALIEIGASASPGASWGQGGNISSGTFLANEGVPSNKSGRTIFLSNATIKKLFTSSETLDTYTLQIYQHDGDEINLTLLGSVSVVAARTGSFTLNISVTTGKQLAIKLSSGSAKNIVVGAILKGGL